jgi:hypothetical protein
VRHAIRAAAAAALLFFVSTNLSSAVVIKQVPSVPSARSTKDALRIAHNASRIARKMNSVGRCYRGVTLAMRDFGVTLTGMAAYEAKGQLIRDRRFKVVHANRTKDLRTGDILVNGPIKTHPYGHIAVYLGQDQEASDHIQPVLFNTIFGKTTVFRLKDSKKRTRA